MKVITSESFLWGSGNYRIHVCIVAFCIDSDTVDLFSFSEKKKKEKKKDDVDGTSTMDEFVKVADSRVKGEVIF